MAASSLSPSSSLPSSPTHYDIYVAIIIIIVVVIIIFIILYCSSSSSSSSLSSSFSPSSSFPSTSSPSSSSPYDIFLSFRGEDTRKNFTSHLFAALNNQGYNVFHDTMLPRGQRVSSQLLMAIEQSKLSIVVFSKNYADSRWCLDELVKIMDCRRSSQQVVLPVFYDVEPSDVRNQKGCYAQAFKNLIKVHEIRQVDKWRAALDEAGNLSGLHLQNDSNGDEAKFITQIINQVAGNLDKQYLHIADYPVGLESRVNELDNLLSLGTNDVRIVAIWGVGGLGKTTIAKASFSKNYKFFQGSCFLADVGATTKQPDGLVTLQKRLISAFLNPDVTNIHNCHQGIDVIRQRLWCRKVLIVLDDVDDLEQLKKLAINRSWLSQGSRVIITTRDRSCVSSLDPKLYEAMPLDERNSFELFKWYAFGEDYPKNGYNVLARKVVNYAGGLPLVLEALGSYMRDLGTKKEWEEALERLRVIPHDNVQSKLRLSFDSLGVREKELFLDIACFFIGEDKDLMIRVLDENSPGYYPKFEFKVLCNRCLVKVDKYGNLAMHDMIRDMGREIVRQESLSDPGRRSRLWYPQDVLRVLKESSGTEATECMILELANSDKREVVDINAFAKMRNLRLIRFRHLNFTGVYDGIQSLDKLKCLSWYGFPFTFIPTNLVVRNLVELDLRNSMLQQLWKGVMVLSKLRFLDVRGSLFLTSTPDFSGVVNLEKLWLSNCKNLVEIHPSILCLEKLVSLDLSNCSKLGVADLWHLVSPRSRESLVSPSSTQRLSCLKKLKLRNCNLSHVPSEIGMLVSLEELDLGGNKFSSLPASIKNLVRLWSLDLSGCCELASLTDLPNNLIVICVEDCVSLETIQIITSGKGPILHVGNATKFTENIMANKGQVLSKLCNVFAEDFDDFPHWCKYRGLSPFLSFVAPQHTYGSIVGWIVALYSDVGDDGYMLANVYNKTKGKMHTVFLGMCAGKLMIKYIEISRYGIVVESGDEIEILFMSNETVHGCGLRLIYDDDDDDDDGNEGLDVDEQLVIQYTPAISYYDLSNKKVYDYDEELDDVDDDDDDDRLLIGYSTGDDFDESNMFMFSSPVVSKRMLYDFWSFEQDDLFVLLKGLVAAGEEGRGGNQDDAGESRQVYHIIANALYTRYVKHLQAAIRKF